MNKCHQALSTYIYFLLSILQSILIYSNLFQSALLQSVQIQASSTSLCHSQSCSVDCSSLCKTNKSQSHLVHIHSITMRPCLCSFDTKQLFSLFQCPLDGVYFLMNLMNDHEIRVSIRRITRVIEERLVKSVCK